MYSLSNFCYVCLENKEKLLNNINSSLSVNKDIIHIIDHLSFNLTWLKSLRIILICDECCVRLRETYQFRGKCIKNSALLQGYRDQLNSTSTASTANVAELCVNLNTTHDAMTAVETQRENEQIYTYQWQPNIEQIGDVFVNFEDSLITAGIISKNDIIDDTFVQQQEVDDPMDNNFTENVDNESDTFQWQPNIEQIGDVFVDFEDSLIKAGIISKDEIIEDTFVQQQEVDDPMDNNSTENVDNESDLSLSDNAHATTDESDLNTTVKSHECVKLGSVESLVHHSRVHTGEKPYKCSRCKKCFSKTSGLVRHTRVHTGEKPYTCSRCKKCFSQNSILVRHTRVHTGAKPYSCSTCDKCFSLKTSLVAHVQVHTGAKPYACSRCKKCFSQASSLVRHTRLHTGEKP